VASRERKAEMANDDGTDRPLVTLKERADLPGENFETLRAQAQEGKLPGARKDNRGRWLVPLPQGAPREPPGSGLGELVAELRERLARAEAEMERLRGRVEAVQAEAEAARLTAAKAEGERDTAREVRAAEVAAKDALIAELKAILAEARRSWWRKLMGN
jgi:uncharacterized coiled-coil protein SlyX